MIVVLAFVSCGIIPPGDDPPVARVRWKILYRSDVVSALGDNPNPQAQRQFVDLWVEHQLWKIEAKKHIRLDAALRDQVRKYRSSLLIRTYREKTILNTIMIPENDVIKYYEENKAAFLVDTETAFIELYTCDKLSSAKDVVSALRSASSAPVLPQLMLVKKGSLVKPLDEKIFSKRNDNILGPIEDRGNYYIVSVVEVYKKNTLLGLEHVRNDIIQKLRMAKYSSAVQKKQKELKDRINVKIY